MTDNADMLGNVTNSQEMSKFTNNHATAFLEKYCVGSLGKVIEKVLEFANLNLSIFLMYSYL